VVALDGLAAAGAAVGDVPPAAPAPAACASPIELESASALTNVIVANFMGFSLVWLSRDNLKGATDVPSPLDEHGVRFHQ
jgi:hypothetical protein